MCQFCYDWLQHDLLLIKVGNIDFSILRTTTRKVFIESKSELL